MLKVVLTSLCFIIIIIILADLALDTILLLRQLVFCTYTLCGTVKIQYGHGRVLNVISGVVMPRHSPLITRQNCKSHFVGFVMMLLVKWKWLGGVRCFYIQQSLTIQKYVCMN